MVMCLNVMMISALFTAASLAVLTFNHLNLTSKISTKSGRLQRKLLIALCAQVSSLPLLHMFAANLFHYFTNIACLCVQLLYKFPQTAQYLPNFEFILNFRFTGLSPLSVRLHSLSPGHEHSLLSHSDHYRTRCERAVLDVFSGTNYAYLVGHIDRFSRTINCICDDKYTKMKKENNADASAISPPAVRWITGNGYRVINTFTFPAWDAAVIIILISDYRRGLMRMVGMSMETAKVLKLQQQLQKPSAIATISES